MGKLFGTDGVRGIANLELTNGLAYKLGRVGAYVLSRGKEKTRVLIGKDTRISGDMLEASMIAGILSVGGDVIRAGVLPTPAVAYLVQDMKLDAGIMISASHNPAEYNGIKFFNGQGFKLSDAVEDEIEAYILGEKTLPIEESGLRIGRLTELSKAQDLYQAFALSTVDTTFEGLRIAMDTANGAAYQVAPAAFKKLKADVTVLHDSPDGVNINHNCGSTHMDHLAQVVLEGNYDLGLAFDGDADRLLAVDEKGRIVDGDRIMNICARGMLERGELDASTVVATVMSNIGLEKALAKAGIKVAKTQVGDRYVLEEMLAQGYKLGGEQSGHVIFLNHNTTGDGLMTALQLVRAMVESKQPLSALYDSMTSYPQVLRNARVQNQWKYRYMENQEIAEKIAEIEARFAGNGRVLIRPSGTEPLVRVMIEGEDQQILEHEATLLAKLIEKHLG